MKGVSAVKKVPKGWITVTVRVTKDMKAELKKKLPYRETLSGFMRKAALREIDYHPIE